VVEAKDDGTLFITTDQGKRVTQAEGDLLAQGYDTLGHTDPMFANLTTHPIAVGENAESLVAGLEAALARGVIGHVGFGDASATLRSTRSVGGQPCGVFALRMQVAYKLEKVESRADMSGELVVRTADTLPVSLSLAGPVVMSGQTARADVEGQGDARVEITWAAP
jgi:hypothetical protein